MINPFKILGVHLQSEPSDVRKAYIDLMRVNHPDKGGDHKRASEINEAYKILTNRMLFSTWRKNAMISCPECRTCRGKGATYDQVGFGVKIFKRCLVCEGAGVLIHAARRGR
jgi:DnaJ-class molecular chaperone